MTVELSLVADNGICTERREDVVPVDPPTPIQVTEGRNGAELGRQLLAVLDAYDEWLLDYQRMSDGLSKAFFDLGQTKYILGPANVSHLQYDLRMKAKRLLSVPWDAYEAFQPPPCVLLTSRSSYLISEPSFGNQEESAAKSLEPRKRTLPSKDIKSSDAQSTSTKPQSEERKRIKDPIQWFAFLPPQPLKRSQQNFVQALEMYLSLAAQKRSLLALLDAYSQPCDNLPPAANK